MQQVAESWLQSAFQSTAETAVAGDDDDETTVSDMALAAAIRDPTLTGEDPAGVLQ